MLEFRREVKKYRILMIAPTMFFADYGGHIRILEEAKILRELGHQVTILTYPNGQDIARLDIRRCLGVPFNYRVEVGASRHKFYLDFMLILRALAHIIRQKPDIVHGHIHEGALIGWIVSKVTGAPLVFDFQGSMTSEMIENNFLGSGSYLIKLFKWLERRINHMAKAILTSSKHSAHLLKTDFQVAEGRIHPTPDCVDTKTFSPNILTEQEKISLKQSLNIPLKKQLIVYSGILTTHQGTDHLLKALAYLKNVRADFHLLLMGFPYVIHYQQMAEALGISDIITFTGKMPYQQLPRYLSLGDIATAPKLSATEGCGKILNYMSMALPTVVFDTAVSREFLGQYGIYANDYTVEALAKALSHGLDMAKEDKMRVGSWLRQWAIDNYSWLRTGKQIELVYSAVLAGDPQPAVAAKRATI